MSEHNAKLGITATINEKKYPIKDINKGNWNCAWSPDSDYEVYCNDAFGTDWDWSGTISTHEELGYEDECGLQTSRSGECVLNSENGDPRLCCLYGASGDYNISCDKKYTNNRFESSACRSYWHQECSGEDLLSDKYCNEYYNANLNDSTVIGKVSAVCNNDLDYPGCKVFCLANDGKCDSSVKNYCDYTPKDDPLCYCLNSPAVDYPAITPVCVDAKCKNNESYITGAMAQITTCKSVTCSVIQNLAAGGNINFTNNVIEQNCNLEGNSSSPDPVNPVNSGNPGNPVNPVDSVDGPKTDSTPTFTQHFTEYKTVYGVGSLILFIFIVFLIVSSGSTEYVRRRKMRPKLRNRRY